MAQRGYWRVKVKGFCKSEWSEWHSNFSGFGFIQEGSNLTQSLFIIQLSVLYIEEGNNHAKSETD